MVKPTLGIMINDWDSEPTLIQRSARVALHGTAGKWRKIQKVLNGPRDVSLLNEYHEIFHKTGIDGLKLHTLAWAKPDFYPRGFPIEDRNARIQATNAHIKELLTEETGYWKYIDVYNEPIDLKGNGLKGDLTNLEVAMAFQTAAVHRPKALLGLNEHSCERIPEKLDAYIELASKLQKMQTSLHYLGFQMHLKLGFPYSKAGFVEMFQKVRAEVPGTEIHVTELDISTVDYEGEDWEQAQADLARMLLEACRECNVEVVIFWGTQDESSWLKARAAEKGKDPNKEWPCLYKDGKPKKVCGVIAELLL